ncbi:MAG: Maff2 family protein [Ruminococcus sp.]|nr:Maff2 family protein [Ruminococcus sp.]
MSWKLSCTVWGGGKFGDYIKGLPIVESTYSAYFMQGWYTSGAKSQGMKQLMSGLGLILLAIVLVPVLETMMTGAI